MVRRPFFIIALFSVASTSCHMLPQEFSSHDFSENKSPARGSEPLPERTENSFVRTDANRDGRINQLDDSSAPWSWRDNGALVLPNLDDDNQDGQADCLDHTVNGAADEKDLTEVQVNIGDATMDDDLRLQLKATSDAAPVQWFLETASGWQRLDHSFFIKKDQRKSRFLKLAVEACAFASADWDGFMTVSLETEQRGTIGQLTLRVSPFLMIPNTQPVEALFISQDLSNHYDNQQLLQELPFALFLNRASLSIYKTDTWQEMWMQDTMEIGYSESSTSRMHVILNAPRGHDRYGRSLLAPNVGYVEVAQVRSVQDQTDGWLDWFGNLEVSPPTNKFPFGRIYYGYNPETGNGMHPEIVDFLKAQEVQAPIALDVGWLFIKHVDEMLSFWPDKRTGEFVAVLPSPHRAAELLETPMDDFNADVQNRINAIIEGTESRPALRDVFGLDQQRIVSSPLLYNSGEYGAVGQWSNPVNSVALSSSVLFGKTDVPEPVLKTIKADIKALNLIPIALDDSAYQAKLGNLHCATNVRRKAMRAFYPLK